MKNLGIILTLPLWFSIATLGFICGYIAVFFEGGFMAALKYLDKHNTSPQIQGK